eukprot:6086479-Amphidinium_carterae.1
MLLSLWPLFSCDMRRPPSNVIVATDATTQRGGVVIGQMTPEEAVWVWGRLPRRPGAIPWLTLEGSIEVDVKVSPDPWLEDFICSHKLE